MAENCSRFGELLQDHVKVGAADPTFGDLHQHFVRPGFWHWHLFDLDLAVPHVDGCWHRLGRHAPNTKCVFSTAPGAATCNRERVQRVWYVSYGSNLLRTRFLAYIQGGRVTGNDVEYEGCRDTSPPEGDVALTIPHSLHFAGWSDRVWGGTSAAFISLRTPHPPALARAYRITEEQFLDVVWQENANGTAVEEFEDTVERARRHGHARLLQSGAYSELVYCGERDGEPMLTFTHSEEPPGGGAPSSAYLRVIGNGLCESHGLAATDVANYLLDRPGVRPGWTRTQLLQILEASGPASSEGQAAPEVRRRLG